MIYRSSDCKSIYTDPSIYLSFYIYLSLYLSLYI